VGDTCDYSIRLNWNGRASKKNALGETWFQVSPSATSHAGESTGSEYVLSPVTPHTSQSVTPWRGSSPQAIANFESSLAQLPADASPSQPPPSGSELTFQIQGYEPSISPKQRRQAPPKGGVILTDDGAQARKSFSDDSDASGSRPIKRPRTAEQARSPAPPGLEVPRPSLGFPRLSVSSLLSAEDENPVKESTCPSGEATGNTEPGLTRYYGLDHGLQDLDIGKNDDNNAVSPSSPRQARVARRTPGDIKTDTPEYFVDDPEGYYHHPVAIHIPRSLEPLPSKLVENPMNLLVCSSAIIAPMPTLSQNPVLPPLPIPHSKGPRPL
jgi:hypothetical protein